MPFRGKRSNRGPKSKRTTRSKQKRNYNRGRGKAGVPRHLASNNFWTTQVFRMDSISPILISNKTSDSNDHLAFRLSQVAGAGPFKALYHFYRVLKVKFEFIPCNNVLKDATNTTFRPSLYTSINRAAETFADNVIKQMSTPSCRYTLAGKYHCRMYTPAVLDQLYDSAATTGYAQNYGQWISTSDTAVPHFGLDVTLAAATGDDNTSYKYRLVTTAICQFKARKANIDLALSDSQVAKPDIEEISEA